MIPCIKRPKLQVSKGLQASPAPLSATNTSERLALGIVVLLAFILRVYGIDFGLPYLYDPDEPIFIRPALGMVLNGDLNPHWFGHPGSTVIYLNAVFFKILEAIGYNLGWFSDLNGFQSFYINNPTFFYLIPRTFYAFIGTATVLGTFYVARQVYNQRLAFIAALALAVSPIHINYSQLVRTDILMTGLVLLVAYHSLRILNSRPIGPYVFAGAFLGAAVATKYPALMAATMILVAHILAGEARVAESWKLITAGAITVASLFICSPYLFFDYETVLKNLIHESRTSHLSANGGGFIENMWWYITIALSRTTGWLLLALSFLGLLVAARQRRKEVIVLATFPIVFLVFIASLSLRHERWIIPMLPFISILALGGLQALTGLVQSRWPRLPANGIIYGVAVAMLLPVATNAVMGVQHRSGADTRTVARDWILSNVPPGSRLLVEAYGPQLPHGQYQLFNIRKNGMIITRELGSKRPDKLPSSRVGKLGSLEVLFEKNIDYVVLSNFYDRYRKESARYPNIVARYEELFGIAELVIEITSTEGQKNEMNVSMGPTIRILRLPTSTTPVRPGIADPN